MAAALLPIDIPWGQQKPPYGTKINRAHPLLSAGGSVWAFNEGAGATAYDGLGNKPGTLSGSLPKWSGVGLKFRGSANTDYVTFGTPSPDAYPWFSYVRFSYSQMSAYQSIIGYGSGSVNPYHGWSIKINTSNVLSLNVYNGANTTSTGPTVLTGGLIYEAFLEAISQSQWNLYLNGKLEISGFNPGANPIARSDSFNRVTIGFPVTVGSPTTDTYFGGTVYESLFAVGSPTQGQAQQLYAAPYSLWQPRTLWLPVSRAAPSGPYFRRTRGEFGARTGSRQVAA